MHASRSSGLADRRPDPNVARPTLLYALRLRLVLLMVQRAKAELAAERATWMLQDMGMDDCPVCIANRRRDAWMGR